MAHRVGWPSLKLSLVFGMSMASACGEGAAGPGQGPAKSASEQEAPPAPPCSVNGMLFRDTDATEFEQCGLTKGPMTGAVKACATAAMKVKRPFVVQIEVAGIVPVPAHRRPAIVGADFGAGYELRQYMSLAPGEGERVQVDLMMRNPSDQALSTMHNPQTRKRCVLSKAPPPSSEGSWAEAGPHRKVNKAACTEWYDAAAWHAQPWVARFDVASRMNCEP